MPKITTEVRKQLKEILKDLPKTARRAREYRNIKPFDNTANEIKNATHGEAPIIVRESRKRIKVYDEVYVKVNHKKKLKKAFIKSGWSGVMKYVKWVKDNNENIVNTAAIELSMVTISEIMKHKIKPFF